MQRFLIAALAAAAPVLHAAPPSFIHLEEVTRAVVAAHPELAGDSIELPTAIPTREAAPQLEAGPVEHWSSTPNQPGHVRLRCLSETVCRPFYATVHLRLLQEQSKNAEPNRTERESRLAPTAEATLMHAGTHASMLIDSGRIHLRIPVTCLASGGLGAPVRVSGPKSSRVYLATVVDGTTVRGTL